MTLERVLDKEPQVLKKSPYLTIAITNNCNFDCSYCPTTEGGGHGEGFNTGLAKADFAIIKDAVRVAKQLGIEKVRYTGGEPLVVKGVMELVTFSLDTGLETALSTNGSLLHKHWETLEGLRDGGNPVDLRISLDTLDKKKAAQIWRVPEHAAILAFENIEEAAKRRLLARVGMVVSSENHHEVEAIIEYCGGLGINLKLLDLYATDHNSKRAWREGYYPLSDIRERLLPRCESERILPYTLNYVYSNLTSVRFG